MNAQKPTLDTLTGLPRREVFFEDFAEAIAKAKENTQPVTIGLLDLDLFLKINDQFGHEAGDAVLVAIANIIQDETGDEAQAYRYGGDEFALLFTGTERELAFLTLERIRAAVEQRETFGEGKQAVNVNQTVSGGLASYPTDGNVEDELVRKAYQALYRAKRTGSNKVLLSIDERMVPKTTHFTETQLKRLAEIANDTEKSEAQLLREALDGLIFKYNVTDIER